MTTDWHEHFHSFADRWVDDAYVPKPSEVPEIVYHYTDAVGLVGMMRQGSIWVTDYRFLNDLSELEHTKLIARQVIEDKMLECADNSKSIFYNDVREYQNMQSSTDVFFFSMSEERDDLSQWRGYARDGMGFTLGLSGPSLAKAAESLDCEYSFCKVDYNHAKQQSSIERILIDFEREIRAQSEKHPKELDNILSEAAREFDWCCEQRSAANKHQSFRLEKEWRILTYVEEKMKKKEVKTRASGNRLVNYSELKLGSDGRLPIVSIGIGPGFRGAEQRIAVEALCRETGYGPEIYPADTPYRRH